MKTPGGLDNTNVSLWLMALIILVTLYSHQEPLSTSISVLCVSLILCRLILQKAQPKRLNILAINLTKNIGALLFTIVIVSSARHLGLINSMVNLLLSGATLWWFTLPPNLTPKLQWHQANMNKLAMCLFFLVAVGFIYEQTLLFSLLFFANTILIWLALFIFQNPQFRVKRSLGLCLRFVISSTLIALLLFLLLPNLSPFWQLPEQQQAQSGISDTMTPGDIASLTNSNRLAFRAAFTEQNPQHQDMYWRVLTMPYFDGKTWSAEKHSPSQPRPSTSSQLPIANSTPRQNVTVVAEPSHQPWLYSLAGAISATRNVISSQDETLKLSKPLTSKLKYQLEWHRLTSLADTYKPDYYVSHQRASLSKLNQRLLTRLNPQMHLRTRQQTRKWRSALPDQQPMEPKAATRYVNNITSFFRQNVFSYTLQPPPLDGDHIDQFLFTTRQGFCAHYASAAAVMIRQSGIPARVVAGYHGGEYNPNGNYFNVYDSAAHAWVEYWLADEAGSSQGTWIRFDPTAAIAPERIQNGLDRTATLGQSSEPQAIDLIRSVPWLNTLRQKLQSLDYYWTIWVLEFDPDRKENRIATWLKSTSISYIVITVTIILLLALTLIWRLYYYQPRATGINRLLLLLEKQLVQVAKNNNRKPSPDKIERRPAQTLRSYQQHLNALFPNQQPLLNQIFMLLEQYLYQTNQATTLNSGTGELSATKLEQQISAMIKQLRQDQ